MEDLDPKWIHVSSILKMMPTLGSDGEWGYPFQKINQEILKHAAERGSAVHQAIECHISDTFSVLSQEEIPYFESFLKWHDSLSHKNIHHVEKRLYYEPMRLTGKIDMIAQTEKEGMYRIIDFKCTSAPDHTKWPLQGALYHFLGSMNGMCLNKTCYFIQLNKEGDFPKVHQYTVTKDLTAAAMSLYNLYIYLTKN